MTCHSGSPSEATPTTARTIALVGHPNVGKSALFHRLTGTYVTVANYPGTTVDTIRGAASTLPEVVFVDTPGLVSLPGLTEDERFTERLLLDEPLRAVIQVGDAKNLRRTLLLTVPLAEMGLPLALALNMADEAGAAGAAATAGRLTAALALPVIPTVAIHGAGVAALSQAADRAVPAQVQVTYPAEIEVELDRLSADLPPAPIGKRAMGILWLLDDPTYDAWLDGRLPSDVRSRLEARRADLQRRLSRPLAEVVHQARLELVDRLLAGGEPADERPPGFAERFGRWCLHPVWGLGVLAGVLLGIYAFVGVFGAQTLVGWLEGDLFADRVNPWLVGLAQTWVPWPLLRDLLAGPYGLWTMGITYALALILPIVATFFLAFGLLEDSGYLPRLAVLTHNLFRRIGLNGKAVLPMVLGLGCVTTATVTTRILETRRERLLATLLLALAVPCSAQLGVVLGVLAAVSFSATAIWGAVVLGVLLAIGWLAAQLVPGERATLLVEVPPLRVPRPANILIKTAARLEWYMREVVPFFLAGSLLLFVLDRLGWLAVLTRVGEPLVTGWLGLPPEAGMAFVLGFLRRDFGATGLFALAAAGQLSAQQAVVGMVTITLFIPCVAAVLMIARERGWRSAAAISAVVFPLAFGVGGLLRFGLLLSGWSG